MGYPYVLLGIGYRCLGSENYSDGLPGLERSLTIYSAVWIQYMNVTDRQTDGQVDEQRHRPTAKTAHA